MKLSWLLLVLAGTVHANEFEKLVGWTIYDVLPVEAFTDTETKSIGDFRGCVDGRVIIYDAGKSLVCAETQPLFQYLYRPTAIIVERNGHLRMIVGDVIYEMRRF